MNPICRWLFFFPKCRLRLIPVPWILLACNVAVEDRLMLKLIAAKAPREGIFSPDDLATDREAGRLQRVLKFPLPGRGMANVQRGAWLHNRTARTKRSFQKLLELGIGHAVALNRELFFCIACVLDVVGRIGENQIRRIADHQPCNVALVCRVPDEQLVTPQDPKVPGNRDWRLRQIRNRIFIRETFRGILFRKQSRQLRILKADQIEVEVLRLQRRKLSAEKFLIPSGVQRELVVRDDVRSLLRFGQVIEYDHRQFFEP